MDKNQTHQLDPETAEIKRLKEKIKDLETHLYRVERVYQERIIQLQEVNGKLSQTLDDTRLKYEKGSDDSLTGDASIADNRQAGGKDRAGFA